MKNLVFSVVLIITLTGCLFTRTEVSLAQKFGQVNVLEKNGKSIYIQTVIDKRIFENNPRSPRIPSLKDNELQNNEIKSRAIARKRNGYGGAEGDVLLKNGQTVVFVIKENVEIAFSDLGYTIIQNPKDITDNTILVDIDVNKFWSWMTPIFVSIILDSEISTNVTLTEHGKENKYTFKVATTEHSATAFDSDWIAMTQKVLKLHIEEIKKKIQLSQNS
jgi:hypothetical protein